MAARLTLILALLAGLSAAGALSSAYAADPLSAPGSSPLSTPARSPAPAIRLHPRPSNPSAPVEACRQACDRAHYLCLSDPPRDDCDPTWSACRSDCDHPPDAPSGRTD